MDATFDDRIKYLAFCFEVYGHETGLDGRATLEVFQKYKFIPYIMDMYELLHVHGTKYLMEDLEEYRLAQAA